MLSATELYKSNMGMVHAVSKKGFGRLCSLGVSIDYEDVFQEMSVTFINAYNRFDESKGWKFSTYFYTSAFNRLNSWIADISSERIKHGVISIEEISSFTEEGSDMSSVILNDEDADTPDSRYATQQFLSHADKILSPLASLILGWTILPPEALLEQLRQAEAHAQYGRSLGLPKRCMAKLTPRYVGSFVMLLTGVPNIQVVEAIRELSALEYVEFKKFF